MHVLGCLVIWARLSDIYGRKPACVAAFVIFSALSGACGGAQSMTQLIIFRVFQGVGVPLYTTIVMILFALAFALGPVFGGLITNSGSWRWVFLLNVPAGVLTANHWRNKGVNSFDYVGSLITLASLALLITGLEEAASLLDWKSPRVLGPLVPSGLSWLLFFLSQWHISQPGHSKQPVFPWHFCQNRVVMGLFINTFLTGAVNVTCMVLIPIRYQTAAGLSPLQAGAQLILFSVASLIGAILAASICKKRCVALIYVMFIGEFIQIIVLIGLGMGLVIGTATLLAPAIFGRPDLSGSAAVVHGGNTWIRYMVTPLLDPEEVTSLFRSTVVISTFPDDLEYQVRGLFVESFNLQMRIVLGVAVVSVLSTALMLQKPQIKVP
ncbi:putative multidrug resistance protein fnx1 [Xylaria sp. FL0064]|nr:putative multidrug resistance protein fnx1 [Xylaria sp. FL0064]